MIGSMIQEPVEVTAEREVFAGYSDSLKGSSRIAALMVWMLLLPAEISWAQDTVQRHQGPYTVPAGEIVTAHLVVENGTVSVNGEVTGSVVVWQGDAVIRGLVRGPVVVFYGDVIVRDRGRISGDAATISGEIMLREQGTITGSQVVTTLRGLERQAQDVPWAEAARRAGLVEQARGYEPGRDPVADQPPGRRRTPGLRAPFYTYAQSGSFPLGGLVYNRVDGLTLQGEVFGNRYDEETHGTWRYGTKLFAGFGYGFTSKRAYWRVGLNRYWTIGCPFEIGIVYYRQMETNDHWYLTPNENDWMALLARYDWFDYYLRQGFGGHLEVRPLPSLRIGMRYADDEEEAVDRITNWSIFGGDRLFRENVWPVGWDAGERVYQPADTGHFRRLGGYVRYDITRGPRALPTTGLRLEAEGEQVGSTRLGQAGDFDYTRLLVDLRLFQRLSPIDHLSLRLRVGSMQQGDDTYEWLPVQHRFYAGGLAGLRGYGFKAFTGDRLALGSLEYTLGANTPRPSGYTGLGVGLFYDWGLAWQAEAGRELTEELMPTGAMRSLGVRLLPFGITGPRLEIARPLDGDDTSLHTYLRWAYIF